MRVGVVILGGSALLLTLGGCQWYVKDADREVYKIIAQRQQEALGATSDVRLPAGPPAPPPSDDPYSFVPHPVTPEVPAAFRAGKQEEEAQEGTLPVNEQDAEELPHPDVELPEEGQQPVEEQEGKEDLQPVEEQEAEELPQPGVELPESEDEDPYAKERSQAEELLAQAEKVPDFGRPFLLEEALAYAGKNARQYQDAKEDLYLAALALTLERHLWTPLFTNSLRANYTEFPQNSDPDRALDAVADVAVEQRLPYGGQVVAQWIGAMVRDLENHVTTAESGTAILRADIPLLRGAGKVAYESRYQGERDMIYAVRRYERFRRSFLTQVASEYFNLLSLKASIRNAEANREASRENWERSQAMVDAERIIRQEADRAHVELLLARNRVILAIETYESALDEFKILIGMPTTEAIDAIEEELYLPIPEFDEHIAINTALDLRLDLLTTLDRVDDARRGVQIAKNNLLPDLDLSGGVSYTTRDDHLSAFDFREDNETWTIGGNLELPIDRKAERNAYRSSLINLRRSQRNYELAADRVTLEVRRAMRQIRRTQFSLLIQEENIRSNEVRRDAAQARFEIGELSNRDVVDANNDLLEARDSYANAVSDFRIAIFQFRLATGTLRIGIDGHWAD